MKIHKLDFTLSGVAVFCYYLLLHLITCVTETQYGHFQTATFCNKQFKRVLQYFRLLHGWKLMCEYYVCIKAYRWLSNFQELYSNRCSKWNFRNRFHVVFIIIHYLLQISAYCSHQSSFPITFAKYREMHVTVPVDTHPMFISILLCRHCLYQYMLFANWTSVMLLLYMFADAELPTSVHSHQKNAFIISMLWKQDYVGALVYHKSQGLSSLLIY